MQAHISINNKQTMNRNRLCSAMFTRLYKIMRNDNPTIPLHVIEYHVNTS